MSEEEFEPKKPEFIVIDDARFEEERERESIEFDEVLMIFDQLGKIKYPFIVRLIFFFASFFVCFGLILVTPFVLLFGVLTLVTLGLYSPFQIAFRQLFRGFMQMIIGIISLLVATLDPPFGIGIFLLYSLIHGEKQGQKIVGRFIKRRFTTSDFER